MNPVHVLPGLIASARFVSQGTELAVGPNEFSYTGAIVERVIPAGMEWVILELWGGSGATNPDTGGFRDAGGGGHTHLVIEVQEGDVLEIWTGQGGGPGQNSPSDVGGYGGWPDGGDGGTTDSIAGGGGGGSSRVYLNGVLIAIAGGGGGENGSSGTQGSGGAGGGAAPGIHSGTNDGQMTAASQTAAGTNTLNAIRNGAAFQGGHGWLSTDRFTSTGSTGAGHGGGGGGLYGGAAGENRGGGGGSGWAMPVDGGSNSPLDRQVASSLTENSVTDDGIGRQYLGWKRWLGYSCEDGDPTDGGDLFNSHDGGIYIFGVAPGGDALLGRLPVDILAEHLTSNAVTVNALCFRQFTAPHDMVIDELGFYTSNTNDSNSVLGTSVTLATGMLLAIYNDAGVANSPGMLLARTANQTVVNDGENWWPLNQEVAIKQGQIVWIAFNSANNITQSSDRVALASGQARRATGMTYTTDPTKSQLWGVSNSLRTDAYPIAGRGYVPTGDADEDIVIAVVPFTTPTSTGTLDVTDILLDGRVPKGIAIYGGCAPANTTDQAHIGWNFGVASRAGNHQYCVSANLEDGQANADGNTDQRTGAVAGGYGVNGGGYVISLATPGDTVAASPLVRASIDSWITNGVRLNFTAVDGSVARQFFMVLFAGKGIDCAACVKSDYASGVTQFDRLGPTECLLVGGESSNTGNTDGDQGVSSRYSIGLGFINSNGDQGQVAMKQADGAATAGSPAGSASNTVFEAIQDPAATTFAGKVNAQGWDADGFEFNSTASLTSTDTIFLALRSNANLNVAVIDFTTPTTTGVQNVTGAGFQPKAAIILGHTATAWDTGIYNSDDASGMGVAAFDVNGGVGLSVVNRAVDPSFVKSSAHDNEFNIGRGAGSRTLNADWDGFTSDGFDLDWQAVHSSAVRGLAICFGW